MIFTESPKSFQTWTSNGPRSFLYTHQKHKTVNQDGSSLTKIAWIAWSRKEVLLFHWKYENQPDTLLHKRKSQKES